MGGYRIPSGCLLRLFCVGKIVCSSYQLCSSRSDENKARTSSVGAALLGGLPRNGTWHTSKNVAHFT